MRYLQRGLIEHDKDKAADGFTLYATQFDHKCLLIDMAGEVVHQWDLPGQTGNYAYLLANGNLLVATWTGGGPEAFSAKGGLIQELDWDGNVVFEYRDEFQHHDFRRCADGNTIYLGWEVLPGEAAAAVKGGLPGTETEAGMWGDYIREVTPDGDTAWEWHACDHLDFGKYPLHPGANRREYAHPNTIQPLADGNILVCYRHTDVLAIIDRATGKYSWERHDADWGGPHDAQILENGNMMVFANRGGQRPRGSKIIEFDMKTGDTVWEYKGNPTHTFDSHFISGCQRLWNGNTLICEGLWGRFFEVTEAGELVWEFINPITIRRETGPTVGDVSSVFRAYRYAPDGPEIQGRLS
ncbi:MAG: aryl-sulfate sulfotransferase [Rhodospirillales bacterium]|jgi:hypothetical protein|nr:aryl sulfotransferase [Rhodospirillaceae bacterium]MDP6429303.1 aryl-sulfate sulfotransferase [Rhodospirillales bacterium]MDP6643664.1 aryl-sulfate sulfotransferase [Rhodospirillales bacterium]MDP6840267.1 aryl-sulfate sulfotransferase [Rhodospirillales bacterium]